MRVSDASRFQANQSAIENALSRLNGAQRAISTGKKLMLPSDSPLDAAFATLDSERTALRDAIIAADGLALGTVRLPHPRFGDLDLYQWFTFLGAHEARHVEQVRETAAALEAGLR